MLVRGTGANSRLEKSRSVTPDALSTDFDCRGRSIAGSTINGPTIDDPSSAGRFRPAGVRTPIKRLCEPMSDY
jgi:hypothetical protein